LILLAPVDWHQGDSSSVAAAALIAAAVTIAAPVALVTAVARLMVPLITAVARLIPLVAADARLIPVVTAVAMLVLMMARGEVGSRRRGWLMATSEMMVVVTEVPSRCGIAHRLRRRLAR
jgi:hypothetical protein